MSGKRCSCFTESPKGKRYHPALKTVYERKGVDAVFVPTGYKCPKCGRWYDLE